MPTPAPSRIDSRIFPHRRESSRTRQISREVASFVFIACIAAIGVLGTANAARASAPALPLPAWVKIDLATATPPLLGEPERLTLKMEALLDALPGCTYAIDLPPEVALLSGQTTGTVDLAPGKPSSVSLRVKVNRPVVGAIVSAQVLTRPPRAAIQRAIDAQYAGDAAIKEAGARLVARLPETSPAQTIFGFSATAEQSFFSTTPDPVFLRVVKLPGTDAQFLLLDAILGVDMGAIRQRMVALVPQIEVLSRLATGGAAKVLGERLDEMKLEATKLTYEEALLLLATGDAKSALTLLESADVKNATVPAPLDLGRKLALAVAVALGGDRSKALELLTALKAQPALGPSARYVYFAAAELHRIAGETAKAREGYERAAIYNPSFTIAHTRLAALR